MGTSENVESMGRDRRNPGLVNPMLNPYFKKTLASGQDSWRGVVALAVRHGIPVAAFGRALSYFDGYRSARLPPTCSRPSAIISAPTRTSAWTRRVGSSSTLYWPDPKRPHQPV